jgi:hypothetical protein
MPPSPSRAVEALPSVSLAELDAVAALPDRVDTKYLISPADFAALVQRLGATHAALEIDGRRAFAYRTTYFDTAQLGAYRDHVQRRRRRYKCRSREYLDSGLCTFEVKLKGARGRTVKHRMPYDPARRDELSEPALAFVRACLEQSYGRVPPGRLVPTLAMSYRRITLVAPALGERLTCDFDLAFSAPDGASGRLAQDTVIVESKSRRGHAAADGALRSLGARPQADCSKYCLGVGFTNPSVKSNGLRPLLRRHFRAAPHAAVRGARCLLGAMLVTLALGAPRADAAQLPVVRVDAAGAIPDEPKVEASLRMPGYEGRIGIERRGQSSQRFPKLSYAIELRDTDGKDRKAPLLGMPADGDWILFAPYNDKTLMRNVLAYETARAIGRYAARTRFVELHLDGRYHGIYVLMERLELAGEREQGEALLEFTFPFQARSKAPSFHTPVKRRPIVWEDPERGDLSGQRAGAIARRVRAAERALYGGGDWRRHIDEPAAVDFVLLNELFKNQDGFHASTFMTLHADGRLRLGPVWDFDIAMGNSDHGPSRRLAGWMLKRRDWAERLYRDPGFTRAMAARWTQLRQNGLREQLLAGVSRNREQLRGEVARNFRRWPVLDRRLWPNPRARGTYAAELRHLRSWLARRVAWIDRHIGRL